MKNLKYRIFYIIIETAYQMKCKSIEESCFKMFLVFFVSSFIFQIKPLVIYLSTK